MSSAKKPPRRPKAGSRAAGGERRAAPISAAIATARPGAALRSALGRRGGAKSKPILRGRVWIERGGIALTEAGADLLEQIEATGSLSEAARRLRFSYRRAWMLADGMNRRWAGLLVTTAVGGKRGGGTKVTPLGRAVLSAYRDLQVQLEAMLDHAAGGFERATRGR